jgi:hypothetical protein
MVDAAMKRDKGTSKTGQTELVVTALFIILLSGAVIAQNVTNMSITGDIILNPQPENATNESAHVVEVTKSIDVFANSILEISVNSSEVFENESILVKANLRLDDGSLLANQNVEFFLDGVSLGVVLTDSSGMASMEYVLPAGTDGEKIIKANFAGYDYINPSSAEIQLNINSENQTEPEIKIEKIESPAVVNESEEFEMKVFVTSLNGKSENVKITLENPAGTEIVDETIGKCQTLACLRQKFIRSLPELNENEHTIVTWKLKTGLCGNYNLTVDAEAGSGSKDSKDFDISAICRQIIPASVNYAKLGNLRINVTSIPNGIYHDRNPDTLEGVEKSYYGFYVKVSNDFTTPTGIYSSEENEIFTDIKLFDDLGNEYRPLPAGNVIPDAQGVEGSMNIYPQTIREGYVIFSEIDEKASRLSLIFETAKGNAIFDYEVMRG